MEYTEKYTEQHFVEFKKQFVLIAQEEFNACEDFTNQIEKARDPHDLKQILHNNVEDIYERLGGEFDISEYQYEIDLLESEVESLERQLDEYQSSDYEEVKETLHGDMKFKTFMELHEKYTPWEFEELLKNGKL